MDYSHKGGLYRRADSPFWWLWYWVPSTKKDAKPGEMEQRFASTKKTDEGEARVVLRALERKLAAKAREMGPEATGPLTLLRYGRSWLSRRKASGIESATHDEGRFNHHVAGHALAAMALDAIRPGHLRDFVRQLEAKDSPKGGKLSPRTVRHVYGLLRVLFSDAVADELLAASPCVLKVRRKELPQKRDKDATWRSSAVFSRAEVEALISDARVPENRRVLYALLFLEGARFGEVADQRWRHYEPTAEPLGRLLVASSFSISRKASKGTKTGAPRAVPVHPTLAAVLATWKLSGWARMLGRAPTAADLLIPSAAGEQRRVNYALKQFHADCATLGLEKRRLHDARRTFISLALADGADGALLRRVTHDPPGDQFNQYLTPPWEALCREVAKLRVGLLAGEGITSPLRAVGEMKNPPKSEDLAGGFQRGVGDLNPSTPARGVQSREVSDGKSGTSEDRRRARRRPEWVARNGVMARAGVSA